jgi:hypothetical protein
MENKWEGVTVSHVLIPRSNARLSIGSAWASGSVQLMDFVGLPNVMVPKITLETLRPDFPRLESSCQLCVSYILLFGEGSFGS